MNVYFVGAFCLLVVSLWMMHRAVRVFDLHSLTITAVVYYAYLFLIYVPGIYVFYLYQDVYAGWFYASLNVFLIAYPAGVILVNLASSYTSNESSHFYTRPLTARIGRGFEIVYVFVLVSCTALVAYYLSQVREIPLFYMLAHPGSAETTAVLREESFKLLEPWGPLAYTYAWLRGMILPFLSMIALGSLMHVPSRRAFWLSMLIISLGLATFFAALSVAKAPVAAIFLMLLIYWYLLKSGRIGARSFVLFVVLVLLFPFVVVFIQNGLNLDQIGYAASGIFVRVFISPAEDLYYYFRVFPEQVDFLMGRSVAWVRLIGIESFDAANFVALFQNPSTLYSASSTVAFSGNLWADFGFPGVMLGTVLAGVLVQSIQVYLLRVPRDILTTALFAFLTFALFGLTATSLTTTLVTGGVVPILILVSIITGMETLFRKSFGAGKANT